MKIYDYSGRANISGDRIHQARTAQYSGSVVKTKI